MNRRDFFRNSAVAAFGFMILPGAGRLWKATAAPYEIRYKFQDKYLVPIELDDGTEKLVWRRPHWLARLVSPNKIENLYLQCETAFKSEAEFLKECKERCLYHYHGNIHSFRFQVRQMA